MAWAFQIARIAVLQHYARSARDWTILDQAVMEQIAERLTYYHNGIQRRLTNVHGHVIGDVLR